MKKVLLGLAVMALTATYIGCGHQQGVIATPSEVEKYSTPPDAQAQMEKAAAESAQKGPGN